MKSKVVERILRALVALLGAGIGVALTLMVGRLLRYANPDRVFSAGVIALLCVGAGLLGLLVFLLLSRRILVFFTEIGSAIVTRVDRMPAGQLVTSIAGMIAGMSIAALISQILRFVGSSMVMAVFSAILFLVLGVLGYTIGRRRSGDLVRVFSRVFTFRAKRLKRSRKRPTASAPSDKLVDTSALIDGRLVDICAAGFVEGALVIPDFVLDELRRVADSSDHGKRARGRRGMEILTRLQQTAGIAVGRDATDFADTQDVDAKLLRLARQRKAAILTCDANLARAAQISGVRSLNIHELANALRQAVSTGDVLTVEIAREGREPGQGVAFLPDGTMVVVEGARGRVGETLTVSVTTSLQTSAGRMIFARPEAE